MKKIYPLFFFLAISVSSFAQTGTVADSLVRDSVPILLTDTTSYNSHARIMIYGGNVGNSGFVEEDSTTRYLLFYDKKPDTASFSSIWFRELKNMTPETVFLQSNDSIQVSNPQATNAGVIFYEEQQDSIITVKGLLIDPLTMTGLDTVSIVTVHAPVKMVANSDYVLWLKDSMLFRQSFNVNSGTITLGTTDTLSTHATDVCVADYVSGECIGNCGDIAYLTHENNQSYLFRENYYPNLEDSGLITNIHFNYTDFLFYQKDSLIYQDNTVVQVHYENDTLMAEYPVVDAGLEVLVKTTPSDMRMAFVPDIFPNVFNYSTPENYFLSYSYNCSDTLIENLDGDLYAYPFPLNDTVRNIIMQRGYIFYYDNAIFTWNLQIIFEVGHDNRNALYMVRSSVSDLLSAISSECNPMALQVFPNPVQKAININYQSATNEPVKISLTDITGKTIDEIQIKSVPGKNHYCWENPKLASGVYFLTLSQGNKTQTIKLIK